MDAIRNGKFTSSEIFRLMKSGRAKGSRSVDFYTYVNEVNQERRLGRSIEVQTYARPLSWGKCVEKRAFDVLGLEYTLCSNLTIVHPEIDCWAGSPDAVDSEAVSDLKCPLTLTSFCNMVDGYYERGQLVHDALTIEAVRENHNDGDKFYWQIVSNAILTKKNKGKLICYVPYLRELDEIKTLADGNPAYYWIWAADNEELPYLIEGGHYKNINMIEFDILQSEKDSLTNAVLEAQKLLI